MKIEIKKAPKLTLVCLECGKKRKVSPTASNDECPKCGNAIDFEVIES